jgi:hypothetical protein
MAESRNKRQPKQAADKAGTRHKSVRGRQYPERVIEEGQDTQNDPRPNREKLSGTPLGSDPRE